MGFSGATRLPLAGLVVFRADRLRAELVSNGLFISELRMQQVEIYVEPFRVVSRQSLA